MTNLLERISDGWFPDDEVILESSSERITFQDLRNAASVVPTAYRDQSVAVRLSDPIRFVQTLFKLDGWARVITVIAPSMPDALTTEIMSRAGADTLIADVIEDLRKTEVRPVAGRSDWLLTTSGTTGLPKIVRHSFDSLARSVKGAERMPLRPAWGLLYDPSRFAGLQVVLQSVLGGGRLIVPHESHSLEKRIALLVEKGCSHLSATPSFWRKILMTPNSGSLALRQVTIGGEIADQNLLNALSARYPAARITHIYASTELGVGFAVNDKLSGFPVSYLQAMPDRPALKVSNGQLWAKPVSKAVEGQASHIVRDDEGYIATGDQVVIIGDRVTFLGRESSVVNVGGVKLNLEDVEQKLRLHPAISECLVTSRANPILGSILIFDLVAKEQITDARVFISQIKNWCRENLQREANPAKINLVTGVEIAASGKLRRSVQ